jgi:hypothetical protein
MVVFGGLELVAAGYLIHKYNKTKEEQRRIEEEEERLERLERRSRSDYRRKHSHERRRHSRDRKRRYDDEKHSHEPRPQYLTQPAPQPPRASSAPPPMEGYYPPTGWPQEWKQAQRPERSANPPATDYYNHPKYAESTSQPDPQAEAAAAAYYAQFQRREDGDRKTRRPRGRSESRPYDTTGQLSRVAGNDTSSVPPSQHVRFTLPDDDDAHASGRWDPPPEYRV